MRRLLASLLLLPALACLAEDPPVPKDMPPKPPDAKEMEALWTQLLEKEAFDAVRRLISCPEASVALMKDRLQPTRADEAEIAKRIVQLDDNDFQVREAASKALAAMGALAAPALRKAAQESASPEVRTRANALLEGLETAREYPAEILRTLRCVQVLEAIGTPGAREILERLAAGAPEAPVTVEAKEALKRLEKP